MGIFHGCLRLVFCTSAVLSASFEFSLHRVSTPPAPTRLSRDFSTIYIYGLLILALYLCCLVPWEVQRRLSLLLFDIFYPSCPYPSFSYRSACICLFFGSFKRGKAREEARVGREEVLEVDRGLRLDVRVALYVRISHRFLLSCSGLVLLYRGLVFSLHCCISGTCWVFC